MCFLSSHGEVLSMLFHTCDRPVRHGHRHRDDFHRFDLAGLMVTQHDPTHFVTLAQESQSPNQKGSSKQHHANHANH